MWFPLCTSPGALEPRQRQWTWGHCIFMTKGVEKKKSSRHFFFFFFSEPVECVCTMYCSTVRQPFTVLKWSRSLKGTFLEKIKRKREGQEFGVRAGLLRPMPPAPLTNGVFWTRVGNTVTRVHICLFFCLGGLKTWLDCSPLRPKRYAMANKKNCRIIGHHWE